MRRLPQGCVAFGFIVSLQAMTWACSARTPASVTPEPGPAVDAPQPQVAVDECALVAEPGEPIAAIGIADRIDPANALHPSNEGERLLFGQLYETLVRVDCMGRVRPGLATSWRFDEVSRHWMVTVRENARFSDGTPVTAADVRASWSRDGTGGELRTHVRRLVEWVDVPDDRTLVIRLSSDQYDAPIALAHPNLAVARRAADSRLPLGTRTSRIEAIAASEVTVSRDHLPPLRFLVAPGDPRDLLDAGVDLLLTRDPATLDYAATLPHFQRVPLAWQRTRVLLAPGRHSATPSLSEDRRQVLADDAVRGEARGAQGPFWWETSCHPGAVAAVRPQSAAPRIVYDATDAAARDLAERFVGLARASSPAAAAFLDALLPDRSRRTLQRATGLTREELAKALRSGADAGYVVSVTSRPLDPCAELVDLIDRVPWSRPGTIVPLVDTRLQAVLRRGRSGVAADFDGVLVSPPGSR